MEATATYLTCPKRPGHPRVAQAVCRSCAKSARCPAWREYLAPSLFPDLYAPKPRGQAVERPA